ncbi:TraR/DksA family transcriptional regulator [Nocardioides donggukensis]|uniref:TraR/DksA C4-type zinc finger protein n=1 Tax=Nocardioides donggukensis TaxID=2774019 RepID=A0A927K5D5_9ACTN|nr:TraR/DksA C4-type zinc finger protein [Nocardioides donggukensis]MBD8870592.1 TraR/DksA C4-type zinc finger protein [Nocardioides donggukensis]
MQDSRPEHLHRVTTRLAEERAAIEGRLAALRAEHAELVAAARDSNADDEHDPEGTTLAFERSQLRTVLRQTERHLAEVDAAAARVADGSWGVCQGCGRPIAAERLEARPTATRCVTCA